MSLQPTPPNTSAEKPRVITQKALQPSLDRVALLRGRTAVDVLIVFFGDRLRPITRRPKRALTAYPSPARLSCSRYLRLTA